MQPRIVPSGPHITATHEKGTIIATNVRRLEVLRNCVSFIFENKISDARKVRAVKVFLKNLYECTFEVDLVWYKKVT